MKLTDLIFNTQGVVRTITNFVRHPDDTLFREARRFFERKIEDIEVPLNDKAPKSRSAIPSEQRSVPSTIRTTSSKVQKSTTQAVGRTRGAEPIKKSCLDTDDILIGRWGRYKIEEIVETDLRPISSSRQNHHSAWIKNTYFARNSKSSIVWIEEYRFPSFNDKQMEELKQRVDRLETVSLRSGGVQDFRIITPDDFLVDTTSKTGYLISQKDSEIRNSLREYLEQHGPMSSLQVKRLLAQVLQTLFFLHKQSIRFGDDGSTQQGVIHGNVSLDTVWLENAPSIGGQPQFKIYLKKLALWWDPFEKPKTEIGVITSFDCRHDIRDLGQIAASLLINEANLDDCFQRSNKIEKKLNEHPAWEMHPDKALKDFILHLTDRFTSAESAARELREIEYLSEAEPIEPTEVESGAHQTEGWGYVPWFWLALLSLLGAGCWLFFRSYNIQQTYAPSPSGQDSRREVTKIDDAEIKGNLSKLTKPQYQYASSSLWQDIIGLNRVSPSQNLQMELAKRDSSGGLQKFKLVKNTTNNWQAQLKSGEIAFILQEWIPDLSPEFEQGVVAYDGIAIVVGATDPNKLSTSNDKMTNLPKKMQGSITIDELKEIFTGSRLVRNIDFQALLPKEEKARSTFQSLIFGVGSNAGLISPNRQLLSTNNLLGEIFQNAQKYQAGGEVMIGFERISKVIGQCSVYPLKVQKASQPSAQPLIQDSGAEITPEIDLCHAKGSYWANESAFQGAEAGKSSYPLAYALSIVYLKESNQFTHNSEAARAFHQVLTTDEGQCLLSEAGLVSIKNVRNRGICKGGN
jgi:hypothetical protein